MNHCPVYSRIGGHALRDCLSQAHRSGGQPSNPGNSEGQEITEGCTLNAACGEVCPVEIPTGFNSTTKRRKEFVAKSLSNDGNMQTHPLGPAVNVQVARKHPLVALEAGLQ